MQSKPALTIEKATANWYIMRELCYGSMFRYNRKGEFNIPYGGHSYNHKDLRKKVSHICCSATRNYISKGHFSVLDFGAFLYASKPTKDDFVFVDPPYDSAFSAYDTLVYER